ncbi:CHAT domain-containing protein [Ephemerocybe angulata]|uniref:CHAT domain-containing protein n=1 Tax=Ephemerocybe angulata TaxID=980116 RepID=A0A8H6HYE2_9AGAR|nr:CHAT domain-containing protein [Tulosesus angulatus]
MDQQTSRLAEKLGKASQLCMTDIVFERTGDIDDYAVSMNLAELWVFGIPGSEAGRSFALVKSSPRRWEVKGSTELCIPAELGAIDCVVKSNEGEDIGSLHLDAKVIQSTMAEGNSGNSQRVEMSDAKLQVIMSWEWVEMSSESIQKAENTAVQLQSHGIERLRAFERSGRLADMNDGIRMLRQAVELTPQGHGNLPPRLNNLGGSLTRRFEETGDLSDIAEAISVLKKAVSLTPEGHTHLPGQLNNLGNAFTCLFERTGEISDVSEATSALRKAVELTPQGHVGLPGRLTNLGSSLTRRFQRNGELLDINEAISMREKAVDLLPPGHPNLPSLLNNLGNSFNLRYERTNELSDISKAISARQRAVDTIPPGHVILPLFLSNLGNSFTCRFERTGELSDIAEAISVQQQAVKLMPQGHANLPGQLNNLGTSLISRFERTREPSDIADAISVLRKAVNLTPQGHADRPSRLNNLGAAFTRQFEQTDEVSDISEAISVQQETVKLTPPGHPDLPPRLSNLGALLTRRFQQTKTVSDINEAISVQQRVLKITPHGHAGLPSYFKNLGLSFYNRFELAGDSADLEATLSNYRAAGTSIIGPPRTKLDAAKRWAGTLLQHDTLSLDIIPAFDTALGLVTLVAGLEQTVRGRYTQLEDSSGLALTAAAAACALDRPEKALEWLEQGRCLVWTQLNNLRTPVDELRSHDEKLAELVAVSAKQLESAGSSRGISQPSMSLKEKMSREDEARAHLDSAKEWEGLLRRVRAIPGFESFLKPLPCSALMEHLPGTIVVINMDQSRCDAIALVVGQDKPLHIPLPNFSIKEAREYRADLKSQLQARHLLDRGSDDHETSGNVDFSVRGIRDAPIGESGEYPPVHRVLRGLWEKVVKPILDGLNFSRVDRASGEVPPRLWWCPTGPISFLPLHAAGIYRGSSLESVFDYVVSSYTPTVTAITDRVKSRHSVDAKVSGLFLTSQPNVTGASSINGTSKEVQSILEMANKSGVRAIVLEGDEVTVAECLECMQSFSSIHLACHGSQNATEPLQSRFLFHQGTLELGTILQSDLKNADLAFLSACQTSTGQEKLSDEAVHLAAGMLAAGYRRVVGTMWSIRDKPAQDLATTFYEYLFTHRDGSSGAAFDGALSAHALHHATQKLRLSLDNSERSLLTWIPFVHFGL